jgi:hypothetical protein
MTERRTTPGYYVAVVILAGLVVAAIVLVVAMVLRPGVPGASVLAVTDRAPIACVRDKANTTCFETQVTNNGGSDSMFRCEVRSTGDGQASFASGSTSTEILLGVDQSVDLHSEVVSAGGVDPIAPSVTCEPTST